MIIITNRRRIFTSFLIFFFFYLIDKTGFLVRMVTFVNRPFYSCVLSYLAMNASEAGGDLALIQTSLLLSFECHLVSIRKT